MRTTRILLAAITATMLSSAAFAVAPSASQVTVPAGTEMSHREAKMMALFGSQEERMMFKMQMREATHGMDRKAKKAYRHQEMKRIRAMNDSEKAAWRHGLEAKWSALPADKRERMAAKMERKEQRHESHAGRRHKRQDMDDQAPQQ